MKKTEAQLKSKRGLVNDLDQSYAPQHWHIPENLKHALTLKQACTVYHYSARSLVQKIKKGEIYGCKMAGRWIVFPAGLKSRL